MVTHPNRSRAGHPARNPRPTEVRLARVRAGLTQAEAASLIWANQRSWQKWESGERQMHPAFWELFRLKSERLKKWDMSMEQVHVPGKLTVADVADAVRQFRDKYSNSLENYQQECVDYWRKKEPSQKAPGFCIACSLITSSGESGDCLLSWPTVDLDEALYTLIEWRKHINSGIIVGGNTLKDPCIYFGDFELETDSDSKITVPEYEKIIREQLNAGWFPQWYYTADEFGIR